MSDRVTPRDRHGLLPAVALLPAVTCAVFCLGTLVDNVMRTNHVRVETTPQALSAAIAAGDVELAHAIIHSGQDPNAGIPFSHHALEYWTPDGVVSPLLAATARGDSEMADMLMAYGATLDGSVNRYAPCLAGVLGQASLVELFEKQRPGSTRACTGPGPPLSPTWTSEQ